MFQHVDRPNGIDQKLATRLAADSIIGGFDTIAIAMVVSNMKSADDPTADSRHAIPCYHPETDRKSFIDRGRHISWCKTRPN